MVRRMIMDEMQQEQFTKALTGLVELAKTKKNVLEYNEINDAAWTTAPTTAKSCSPA